MELITTIFLKFRLLIYSFIAAYTAATMRYFKQKREGKKPTIQGWFYFGITAFLVTYSFFAVLEYADLKLPENLKVALGFWVGYMSDFFYSWIPKYLKGYLPDGSELKFSHNAKVIEEADNDGKAGILHNDSDLHPINSNGTDS